MIVKTITMQFEEDGEWHNLPAWAEFFINFGKQLVLADHSKSRNVAAIVVPTRAYCAAFTSLGIVIGDVAKQSLPSKELHFEKLFDLPRGTPVVYRPTPTTILRGILQEPDEHNGKLVIRVQVQSSEPGRSGALTHLIDENRAYQVQPAKDFGALPRHPIEREDRFANNFVESILGAADPIQLGLKPRVVCTFIGHRNTLEQEIRQTVLAVHHDGLLRAKGTLQDVLRVDCFMSDEQIHRCALILPSSSLQTSDVVDKIESVVVFDGSAGYLKWGTKWPRQHLVIVLDRADPFFHEVIIEINSRFLQNHVNAENTIDISGAPPGTELFIFQEEVA